MIRLVEALNFRCLRGVSQAMGDFHVLVGPNASGKTTFLDTMAFLGQLVSDGLEAAVGERTRDFRDLTWGREGNRLDLALELTIPDERQAVLSGKKFVTVRYEVAIGLTSETQGEVAILSEKVFLQEAYLDLSHQQRIMFPEDRTPRSSLITPKGSRIGKTVVNKVPGGNDNFYDETGKGWDHAFKLGPRKSALANLPEDESKFPVATWLKRTLIDGVQRLILNSALMRKPSPPNQPPQFRPDGSNLPWVVESLRKSSPERFAEWIGHLQTALPDLQDVRTIEREEDRHRYLVVRYGGNLDVPSWGVSDGTLRLLALTLPAYLPDLRGVYLIEEPENGIHPRAVETMFQSLSSVYGAQVLLATHSPVILSLAEPKSVLCFAKTPSGATDIVRGDEHPALREWRGDPNLSVLFAGGVLG